MSNKIRYIFLRDAHFYPIGCCAIRLNRQQGFLEYQVSTVNPADRIHHTTGRSIPFNRTVARQLALGRLIDDGLVVPFDPSSNMNEVTVAVMNDLSKLNPPSHKGDIPSRAIKAAKYWLLRNTIKDIK